MQFIPEESSQDLEIPYFEDATTEEHGVRGHSTGRSIEQLKADIRAAVGRLGGSVLAVTAGHFQVEPLRYGYVIDFDFKNHPGRLIVAALPIKKETATKKKNALRQALYTVHSTLEAQYNLLLLSPGSNPLLPYLLVEGGKQTVAELYNERFEVPMLSAGAAHVVDGEIVDG